MTSARTLILVGPTASGKTDLAVRTALRLGAAEVISADSMQIWRGMDVGTAKPTMEERRGVPHHLLDVADPHLEEYTVARWLAAARQAEAEIHARGAVAILVGGTNLYVRAFLEGLFEAPAPDPALRAALDGRTMESLRAELAERDPEAAARIHANDRRRTVRALEVATQTGRPISDQQRQWQDLPPPLPPATRLLGLEWPVPELNRRINARVRRMAEQGFVEEVRGLLARGPLRPQPAEAVGYRELTEHLAGVATLEDALEQTKIRSRRLGKQQRTWLRRFRGIPGGLWYPGDHPDLVDLAVSAVIGQKHHSS